ncbi:MAG: hypothetical protein OEM05_10350 [Myxococcales bacterium]|nr:hypothetical protein [Myxococcales bacterium]
MRKPAMQSVPAAGSAASPIARAAVAAGAAALASVWWFGFHLPKLFVKYYGVRAAKKLLYAIAYRRGSDHRITSPDARRLLADFAERRIAASETYLDPKTFEALDALVDEYGLRETVRTRKATLAGAQAADYFHDSQEKLSPEATERLFGILPSDFQTTLEAARGRRLRLLSVTYHETNPSDAMVRVGDSEYNAHPFHTDGNPKFAKVLIYLTNVGEVSGPFEMFIDSRFSLFQELLRLGYRSKQFKGKQRGIALWARRRVPERLRRETHLWDLDAVTLEARYGPPQRVLGPRGTVAFFDGMNLHNGSRNQKERREVLHFVFV